jgi:parallel beta-helix repeat protein
VIGLVFSGSCGSTGTKSTATGGNVSYDGPSTLSPETLLRARLKLPQPVAAVTYLLDGKPLATATAEPYSVPADTWLARAGRHAIVVEAVTVDNHRYRSQRVPVEVRASRRRVITASPKRNWNLARRALARGHATVRLTPGRYPASGVYLRSGARLIADPGAVLVAPAGSYSTVLTVWGSNITVDGVEIDGGGPGGGLGQAVVVQRSSDVRLRRVIVRRARNYAVYMWGTLRNIAVSDSRLTSAGGAASGVLAGVRDGNDVSVVRTRIAGFRQFGINFAQPAYDVTSSGLRNVALDNHITDIDERAYTNGRSKGGIWTGGPQARILGNLIQRLGWDGIETVGTSTGDFIIGNTVTDTKTGIYVEHSTNDSLIAGNTIRRTNHGINVEWRYGGVGSARNHFTRNVIVGSKTAIFVDAGADENVISHNKILGGGRPAIVLQGSSKNDVHHNRACGAAGDVIGQRDVNVPAVSNALSSNVSASRC